ncbi:MAG: hemolysin family protein [Xanthobacteraceae bacterium]|nr:hemolysin family protein [Xanthobacteraceae bacterium]
MLVELTVVIVLTLINGLLAMAELAVVSSRPSRLQTLVDQHVVGSRRALALAANPGRFLSTVQIGITLIGVLSGAFSGATLGLRLSQWLTTIGVPDRVADALGVGLVVAAITYASLIVGELVPKQIALRNPERIAVRIAPAMTWLAKIASPIVWLLDASGRVLLSLLGHKSQPAHQVSDEEIRSLIAEAETAGVIEPSERQMIAGVMRLGDRPVRALMTPRRDVDMIDLSDDAETVRRAITESIHSRIPVYEGPPENMLGVVQAKDLLNAAIRGDALDIRKLLRSAPTIADTADALDVLEIIKQSPVHLGLIYDEYGHFEGIVTNEDILEAIAGAFRTDDGALEPDAVRRPDGSWLIAGSMPADEMADQLGLRLPQGRTYHTTAGLALNEFGYLPAVGDCFQFGGWRFEVVDLDGRRIDKLLVARMPTRRGG